MAAIGRLALVLGLLLLQPLASESGPDPIGCGSNEAKAVWPGGYAEWNFTPPPSAEVVLATCDTGGDTVLVIDGIEHDDDGICGAARRNERVVVPAGWESKGSVAIRVRFYDPAVQGLLQLGVTCYNTSPPTLSPAAAVSPTPPTPPLTPAPTTTAPTTLGATFAPTAAPTGGLPAGCGYGEQARCRGVLTAFCCASEGLRSLGVATAAFISDTSAIDLEGNGLIVIQGNAFDGLGDLVYLNLNGNELTTIQEGAFAGLAGLVELYLDDNLLTAVPDHALAGLTNLQQFTCDNNQLTAMSEGLCTSLDSLTLFSLHANKMHVIPGRAFAGMTSLGTIFLSANQLTAIPGRAFAGISGLKLLQLAGNQLTTIAADVFAGLPKLMFLHLDDNLLTTIAADAFAGLGRLVYLNLNSNKLPTIQKGAFTGLTGLVELDLDGNLLTAVPDHALASLDSLTLLSLDGNNLTAISTHVFTGLGSLTDLSFNGNNLTAISGGAFSGLGNTTRLSLNGNLLTMLQDDAFTGLGSMASLDLSGNQLTAMTAGALANLSQLYLVDLTNNQLTATPGRILVGSPAQALCQLIVANNALTAITPDAFAGWKCLTELSLVGNRLTTLPDRGFAGLSSLAQLYLNQNELTAIPAAAFGGLGSMLGMYLQDNRLTTLPAGVFAGMGILDLLYLYRNRLTAIPVGAFAGLSRLTELYLNENQLVAIEPRTMDDLEALRLLSLDANRLTTLPPRLLWNCPALAVLAASNNSITRMPVSLVKPTRRTSDGPYMPAIGLESPRISLLFAGNPLRGCLVGTNFRNATLSCDHTCTTGSGFAPTPNNTAFGSSDDWACRRFGMVATPPPACTNALDRISRAVQNHTGDVSGTFYVGDQVRIAGLIDDAQACTGAALFEHYGQGDPTLIAFSLKFNNPGTGAFDITSPTNPGAFVLANGATAALSITPEPSANNYTFRHARLIATDGTGNTVTLINWTMQVKTKRFHVTDSWAQTEIDPSPLATFTVNTTYELTGIDRARWTNAALFGSSQLGDVVFVLSVLDATGTEAAVSDAIVYTNVKDGAALAQIHTPGSWTLQLSARDRSNNTAVLGSWTVEAVQAPASDDSPSAAVAVAVAMALGGTVLALLAVLAVDRTRRHRDHIARNKPVDFAEMVSLMSRDGTLLNMPLDGVLNSIPDTGQGRGRGRGRGRDTQADTELMPLGDHWHNSSFDSSLLDIVANIPEELPRASLDMLAQIGSGNFGIVQKAFYSPAATSLDHVRGRRKLEHLVAVKVLREKTEASHGEFCREAVVNAQFNHTNVVGLVGVVTRGDPYMLVLQFCDKGALDAILVQADVGTDRQLRFGVGIAAGMAYLSAHRFVHRDLASRNVLVSGADVAKVADFGLSRDLENAAYYKMADAGGAMPLRWCSPEVFTKQKFSEASDVWAFGVTMVEVFDRARQPYYGWTNAYVCERVRVGFKLPCPVSCPPAVYTAAILPCFEINPSHRPCFQTLHEALLDRHQGSRAASALERAPTDRDTRSPANIRNGNYNPEQPHVCMFGVVLGVDSSAGERVYDAGALDPVPSQSPELRDALVLSDSCSRPGGSRSPRPSPRTSMIQQQLRQMDTTVEGSVGTYLATPIAARGAPPAPAAESLYAVEHPADAEAVSVCWPLPQSTDYIYDASE